MLGWQRGQAQLGYIWQLGAAALASWEALPKVAADLGREGRVGIGLGRVGTSKTPLPSPLLPGHASSTGLHRFLERRGFFSLLKTPGICINNCIKPLL